MRKLRRLPLSKPAIRVLTRRARQVAASANSKSEMERLWALKKNQTFVEIRQKLSAMAPGLNRCMYCEDSEGTDIEHFWPKSVYPTRAFDWDNYLLACSHCNSNCKREQLPLDQYSRPLLIDPTRDDPRDHLILTPKTGRYVAKTEKGRQSNIVFGLNEREILVRGRRNAWVALEGLIVLYSECRESNDVTRAQQMEQAIRDYPFSSVLAELLYIAAGQGKALINPKCLDALDLHPEITQWL